MGEVVRLHGDLPSIARYHGSIHPDTDRDLAAMVVDRAVTLAGRHAGELAARWRRLHPDWREVIDACLAAVMLEDAGAQDAATGRFVGPVLDDGRGRYLIVEPLGHGSGGRAYEATDRAVGGDGPGGRVAVKLIPIGTGSLEETLAEAGWARRLTSEAVTRVLDAGTVDPPLARMLWAHGRAVFIVQEFIEGLPLHVWKAAHPDASAKVRAGIVAAIGHAIDACRSAGVAHGDLSPANVLVDAGGRARLVDFGRAGAIPSVPPDDPPSSDDERLGQLAEWLGSETDRGRPRMPRTTRGRLAASAAVVAAAASATWFLGIALPGRETIGEAGSAAETEAWARAGMPTDPARWMESVLRDGLPSAEGGPDLQRQAGAWSALAEEQARAGSSKAETELCAAIAALACGERARATHHANDAISAAAGAGDGGTARHARIARLVANLARFFAPGGEDAPPGYAASLEKYARSVGAPGLLRLPVLAERLAANTSAEEPRRFRSEGGGKVFDARSGMTVDIPGYDGK